MQKNILLVIAMCYSFFAQSQQHYMLIGTYTDKGSKGIYVYKFNSKTGAFDSVSVAACNNPSYLAVSSNNNYVYAVTENSDTTKYMLDGGVAAYSFDKKTGQLQFINKQSSAGKHPCYVTIDKTNKWVVVSNYTSGSLAVLPINKDGALDTAKHTKQHFGNSIDKVRQASPHVHSAMFSNDNRILYVADLGVDKLKSYFFNTITGELQHSSSLFSCVPGSGPRHFAIDKKNRFIYIMEELTGTIQVVHFDSNNEYVDVQRLSSHPKDYAGKIGSADIHISPDGNFLYCSNRGESNTIAIFSINKKNGRLTNVGFQSTLGLTPRNFNFDPSGNFLLVANQNSNNIVVYKINRKTGLLTALQQQITVPNPVCIKWIK